MSARAGWPEPDGVTDSSSSPPQTRCVSVLLRTSSQRRVLGHPAARGTLNRSLSLRRPKGSTEGRDSLYLVSVLRLFIAVSSLRRFMTRRSAELAAN
ncbi:hypothetical protein PDJAM_G00008050 [Pangasius djambal]|uniref:Uncharacterized protein n=1 Tax=Pangasius djambal TaxID=1691987 RepID=A0ACC5XZG0_9TELE|nr:hypothetical protein [Pangasius djambal]